MLPEAMTESKAANERTADSRFLASTMATLFLTLVFVGISFFGRSTNLFHWMLYDPDVFFNLFVLAFVTNTLARLVWIWDLRLNVIFAMAAGTVAIVAWFVCRTALMINAFWGL